MGRVEERRLRALERRALEAAREVASMRLHPDDLDALAPYLGAAEQAGGSRSSRSTRGATTPRQRSSSDVNPKAVRAWAEANGVTISPRGRIKADVLEQYRAAGH